MDIFWILDPDPHNNTVDADPQHWYQYHLFLLQYDWNSFIGSFSLLLNDKTSGFVFNQ